MKVPADVLAARLRRGLADRLAEGGGLRTHAWRLAIEQVPREVFLGDRIYQHVGYAAAARWQALTPGDVGEDEWLSMVYENTSWVTQLNGTDEHAGTGAIQGEPSSSSTLPGLVVSMLEHLEVHDDARVLEIGTGTGYSTALLCHRLGDGRVTSIEVDSGIAARAQTALAAAGYRPALIVGDGLAGHAARSPYDRIIATCSVRTIPSAWLAQAAPEARIITTLSGWLFGSGLIALDVVRPDYATGRFLPGAISFMPARAHIAPPLNPVLPPQEGHKRNAVVGPEIFTDWMGRFLAQLAAPYVQYLSLMPDGGDWPQYVLRDSASGAYAWLIHRGSTWMTLQGGPTRLWDRIEQTFLAWQDAGSPPQQEFTIEVTPTAQTIRLDAPTGQLSWTLPSVGDAFRRPGT
ncbi:ATP-grasp peptide maturase system methyltransferase [Thermopolyspora sp. NPDC052614]|uniref:ATP-grasp peptide maturase system methyltransferase n=1 Tax=Thermopolyspora sp. NPDC052614 TaxID=3155682 RepID=UPI00342B565B